MATPTIVQFSPINEAPFEIIEGLGPRLAELDVELESIGKLGTNTDDGRFGFEGHVQACPNFVDASEYAAQWGDIALCLLPPSFGGRCYAYFWRSGTQTYASVELQAGNLYFENEQWEPLQWIRSFLPTLSAGLKSKGSAYDARHDELFEPLSIDKLVAELRGGTLLRAVPLSHYTIRHDVLEAASLRTLVERDGPATLRYSETTSGYYILDHLF